MKEIMVKKFSNAQEVNIFSRSNFYTILFHVLDSEILKNTFFPANLTSSHHLKGYFSKFLPEGGTCPRTPSVAALQTQSTAAI